MFPSTVVTLILLTSFILPSSSFLYDTAYHIDCGSSATATDSFNITWLSDRFASAGSTGIVSEPLNFQSFHEKTVRYFPISSGKKNCYTFPDIPTGRYYLRTFTVYDNYDGKSHSPSFDLSVEGTVVFSWRSPWQEDLSRFGAYSDLMFFTSDGDADVCLYSIATDPPVIGSIELIRIDPASYDPVLTGNDSSILVNYGRLSSGDTEWGPGFSNDTDEFGRAWQADEKFRSVNTIGIQAVTAVRNVINAGVSPNYFPEKLYKSAVTLTGKGNLEYKLPVDAKLDYLVWLHFAEIDVSVNDKGKRVFDVVINDINVTRIDIFKQVGGFAAYDYHYVAKNLSADYLIVQLVPVVGSPLICGLENYAIVPADIMTVPAQAAAMQELKESLRVPERMGWNGDPCAPTSWVAWEGVTCHQDGSALVISRIDLGSQGLKGYISDKVALLTNLVSLNLSSNSLGGTIPVGLGQRSLKKLDLSNNQIKGSIPDTLTSNLQLVILNGNKLEGQVPEELFSIGVHGGAIDLTDNKRLCGGPSLPDCPLLWKNGGLSKVGKIAVGVSCGVVFLLALVITFVCIRRRRNDYDFGLPQELMSLAAKRNKYQRQKSLMALEMESQHAKGFIPSYN
ncbi:receptor-like protein 4 [Bidens hawaiensis]|uniref:receptor-like protein 4 n=1 Tax=Bidens hawaiensis TaxID=980011 RepID=UPI004048F385